MINLIAPINTLGYGVAGYNITKELYKINNKVTLYPIAKPENIDDSGIVAMAINNQINFDKNFPCIKIWHQHDLQLKVGNGKYFGFPIFELTEFNTHEKVSLSHCDEIMVCSHWAKNVIIDQVPKFNKDNVHVVPLGVDTDIFKPSLNNNRSTTIFFNCGKWETRKGHDVLQECFNLAFEYDDDVELWMMCDNPFLGSKNNDWNSLYKQSKLGDKIRIIPRQISHKDVYNIMRLSDCGVFPSKAEGWNLELLEMMACGKNVITTNYSAHTEFCNQDNSMLIEINNLETAFDGGIFFDGQRGFWAEFADNQKEQLITYMRLVHKNKQNNELNVNFNGIKTAEKFSWSNSAKGILNAARL